MSKNVPRNSRLRNVRFMLWTLVTLAAIGAAILFFVPQERIPATEGASAKASPGGPFTLIDGSGKPFSSEALKGKPYAIYFGFTRCGDVCPTTLARLVKLRRQAAGDGAMDIVFITIDPAHDGPMEVGQYAGLFNAPIIGLTGSEARIEDVKRKYGIFSKPVPNAPMGKEMEHSSVVLLFDKAGQMTGTIMGDDSDSDAILKIKRLVS